MTIQEKIDRMIEERGFDGAMDHVLNGLEVILTDSTLSESRRTVLQAAWFFLGRFKHAGEQTQKKTIRPLTRLGALLALVFEQENGEADSLF